jgi:hypothetical protein
MTMVAVAVRLPEEPAMKASGVSNHPVILPDLPLFG